MNVQINDGFVEIIWQAGREKKVLLLKPRDIVNNYHAVQAGNLTGCAHEFVSVPPRWDLKCKFCNAPMEQA